MELITGADAATTAKRKAKYGRRDWLTWTAKNGDKCAALSDAESIKQAMLATGTQGWFFQYEASTGTSHLISWQIGCICLRNAKKGYL